MWKLSNHLKVRGEINAAILELDATTSTKIIKPDTKKSIGCVFILIKKPLFLLFDKHQIFWFDGKFDLIPRNFDEGV